MSCGSGGCSTCEVSENRGCGVSSVFDWLYQIDTPKKEDFNLVEVQFKGDRKEFYINNNNIEINKGDIVSVEGSVSGHDVGKVTMTGELVALQIIPNNRLLARIVRDFRRLVLEADVAVSVAHGIELNARDAVGVSIVRSRYAG